MATAPIPGAVATSAPGPADWSGLWTELLALLWLTAHASQRPDTRRLLRSQGVRRPETLGHHLGDEWRQALRRAAGPADAVPAHRAAGAAPALARHPGPAGGGLCRVGAPPPGGTRSATGRLGARPRAGARRP